MSRFFIVAMVIKPVSTAAWIVPDLRVMGLLVFWGTDMVVLWQLFAPSARWMCPVYCRFETAKPEVWLTIDDGPDAEGTPRLLGLLDQHEARATFFVIGRRVEAVPALMLEVVRRGHSLGCHTYTHPAKLFWAAGPTRTSHEIEECLRALGPAGAQPRWFRPPVGIKNIFLADALARRGLRSIAWSARGFDTRSNRPAAVAEAVLRRVKPGCIILLHEGPSVAPPSRVEAIRLVLEGLQRRGLRCVLPAFTSLR